ncbi:plasmid-related protein [Vogesella indigofera]|uniref:plasmid-related protein n=1 Tax=Vogesella indigofera TaxID=45465 RepID=UPI0035AE128C
MKDSGLRIRVEAQLREDFLRACQKDDLTAAQVLRAFMRSYVDRQRHGEQPDLFQDALSSKKNCWLGRS